MRDGFEPRKVDLSAFLADRICLDFFSFAFGVCLSSRTLDSTIEFPKNMLEYGAFITKIKLNCVTKFAIKNKVA